MPFYEYLKLTVHVFRWRPRYKNILHSLAIDTHILTTSHKSSFLNIAIWRLQSLQFLDISIEPVVSKTTDFSKSRIFPYIFHHFSPRNYGHLRITDYDHFGRSQLRLFIGISPENASTGMPARGNVLTRPTHCQ